MVLVKYMNGEPLAYTQQMRGRAEHKSRSVAGALSLIYCFLPFLERQVVRGLWSWPLWAEWGLDALSKSFHSSMWVAADKLGGAPHWVKGIFPALLENQVAHLVLQGGWPVWTRPGPNLSYWFGSPALLLSSLFLSHIFLTLAFLGLEFTETQYCTAEVDTTGQWDSLKSAGV